MTKKRKRKQKVWITLLLDMTGSMQPYVADTIGGVNTYVEKMQADDSAHYFMTLILFNSHRHAEIVYDRMPVAQVPELTEAVYQPDGMTPLLDAAAGAIENIDRFIQDDKDRTFGIRKQRVLLVILTDGEENYSRTTTRKELAQKIEAREKKGWGTIFLGANIDSFAEAGQMGVPQHAAADFDQKHTGRAFAVAASASVGYTQTGAATISDEDREKLK